MLSSINRNIESQKMIVDANETNKKEERINELKLKRDEILMYYDFHKAQQRLATAIRF